MKSDGSVACHTCSKLVPSGDGYFALGGVVRCVPCTHEYRTERRGSTKQKKRSGQPRRPIQSRGALSTQRRSDGSIKCRVCGALIPRGTAYRVVNTSVHNEPTCMSCWLPSAYSRPALFRSMRSGAPPKKSGKKRRRAKSRSGLLSSGTYRGSHGRARFRTGKRSDYRI